MNYAAIGYHFRYLNREMESSENLMLPWPLGLFTLFTFWYPPCYLQRNTLETATSMHMWGGKIWFAFCETTTWYTTKNVPYVWSIWQYLSPKNRASALKSLAMAPTKARTGLMPLPVTVVWTEWKAIRRWRVFFVSPPSSSSARYADLIAALLPRPRCLQRSGPSSIYHWGTPHSLYM